jgi:hypothetical protein
MDPVFNERFVNDDKTTTTSSNGSIFSSGISIMSWIWIILLVIIWAFAGLTAFFASLVCLFYNSSVSDKVVGLFLSVFFGPLYWGFYIYKASYCTKYPPVNYYYE